MIARRLAALTLTGRVTPGPDPESFFSDVEIAILADFAKERRISGRAVSAPPWGRDRKSDVKAVEFRLNLTPIGTQRASALRKIRRRNRGHGRRRIRGKDLAAEPADPFRPLGGATCGGEDDADPRRVGRHPYREGVDGSLDEECGSGVRPPRDSKADLGLEVPRSRRFGTGFPAAPGASFPDLLLRGLVSALQIGNVAILPQVLVENLLH